MLTYMPIITALKSGFIKPEDFVAYTPDEERSMYTKGIFYIDEEKETEFDLGWHATIYKDFGVLLVADKMTEATITVSDYEKNVSGILENYANLYQNKLLQSTGVAPTTEIVREIPERLRRDNVWCSLNTQKTFFSRPTRRHAYNPAILHDHRRRSSLPTYRTLHMQPILFIPPDTIVEIEDNSKVGKNQKNGFKLYPRNSMNISKLPEQCLEFTNMPMWVPLTEAMRARLILDTNFAEYTPDKASVSFKPNETSAKNLQTAETEYDMGGWHPICLRKGNAYLPYLVATHCSKFKLEIFPETEECDQGYCTSTIGKNQFEIGIELLKRYAKIYSSKELNVQAIPLNEELFDALDGDLISKGDAYYLADTFTNNFHFAAGYPLSVYGLSEYYEQRMGLKWIAHGVLHGYKQCGEPVYKLSIRIAIPLPENIMVQINNFQYDGSTEEKALKLKLASKEENSK